MCCTWPAVTRPLMSIDVYRYRWVLLLSWLLAPACPMAGGYADLNSWAFDLSDHWLRHVSERGRVAMGFFVRRDGMQTQAGSQGESRQVSTAQPAWLPGDTEVQVAGESFHQAAIGAVEARRSPGSPLVAVLVPDPANAYDPNALAVYVNDEHVGFLPRDVAWRVRPALAAFSHAHGGCLVACAAEIRWHDVGPQVVLLIDPQPLGLRAEDFEVIPDMAATIRRLLARLDKPSPPLTGVDAQARSSLARAQEDLEETDANYDRSPGDWPRVEAAFQSVAARLVKAGDPCASTAWLGLGRATRYQRGRRDDTLTALIEALYWDRDNADAWSELVDLASAAPHVPTLLALYARVPFGTRAGVLPQLLSMSEQRDRLGRLDPAQGEQLRQGLRDLAESQGDKATAAALNRRHAPTSTGPVLITRVVPYEHFSNANVYVRGDPSLLPENPLTTVSRSIPGFEHVVPGNVVSFDLKTKRPIAVHLVERGDNRAYSASVSGCGIDLVTGGAFTLTAPGHPDLRVRVPSDMAMRFKTLRNRDVVQVVLGPDATKVEAFWHLARANGAEPRNPCDFPEGFLTEPAGGGSRNPEA